eukprot:TRINITY_DN809_c2_g1_i3.p1 TRINITY_DN809_c2_g1~~TRINITY_DN809_c2_g1_i3.p1  ORF type:complete len:236 (+),score=29.93 TRINITY_DN809_c2_g1_i3:197-904(+)
MGRAKQERPNVCEICVLADGVFLPKLAFKQVRLARVVRCMSSHAPSPYPQRHFGNGDPRWLHATSTGVANISQRALPWDPHGLVTPDPWTTFVPRMNEIYAEPWEQLSRQDHVEESEAWSKFGEPANRTQGAFGSTSQKQSLQFIFMSLDEETSFAKFYAKTFLTSLKMWGSDVYYSYWGCFFDVPLDERYESLGQSYGRRIVKRWYAGQGLSGYKNIKWYDGGLILPTSDNTQW